MADDPAPLDRKRLNSDVDPLSAAARPAAEAAPAAPPAPTAPGAAESAAEGLAEKLAAASVGAEGAGGGPGAPAEDPMVEPPQPHGAGARWAERMQELGLSRLSNEALAADLTDSHAYFLSCTGASLRGKLYVTWYQLVFVPSAEEVRAALGSVPELQLPPSHMALPLGGVDRIEVSRRSAVARHQSVKLIGKTPRSLTLLVADSKDGDKLVAMLHKLIFPDFNPLSFFAFAHRLPLLDAALPSSPDRPFEFDLRAEFSRQGALEPWGPQAPCPWRLSPANAAYALCRSYPRDLVVPSSVADDRLAHVAAFRSEGRIPCLTWGRRGDAGSIWRSSQPRVGAGNSSAADEGLLGAIGGACLPRAALRIVDCRPKAAAIANRATGYGYELQANYPCSELSWHGIPNIHAVRDAFSRLRQLAAPGGPEEAALPQAVADSKWLSQLALLLDAAHEVACEVHLRRRPVLVHCSHGWDRTSQVCALAQLLLDPYFRTIDGLCVLVEKDFCAFGHPFQLRSAHGVRPERRPQDGAQCSPIFLQFLDAAQQLCRAFPQHFEYTPSLLLFLSDAQHSCRFGTFFCDTDRERRDLGCHSGAAPSVWALVRARRDAFASPVYAKPPDKALWRGRADASASFPAGEAPADGWAGALLPKKAALIGGLCLWRDYFFRHSPRLALPHRVLPRALHDLRERVLMRPKDDALEAKRCAGLREEGAPAHRRKWARLRVGGTADRERCSNTDLALGHLLCDTDAMHYALRAAMDAARRKPGDDPRELLENEVVTV